MGRCGACIVNEALAKITGDDSHGRMCEDCLAAIKTLAEAAETVGKGG